MGGVWESSLYLIHSNVECINNIKSNRDNTKRSILASIRQEAQSIRFIKNMMCSCNVMRRYMVFNSKQKAKALQYYFVFVCFCFSPRSHRTTRPHECFAVRP